MRRRSATMGLAALIALSPLVAFAQTATPGGAAPAARSTQADAATPAGAEATYAQRTMAAGALSLELSRIALDRIQDEDVKTFARFEIAEQEGIAYVLKTMRDPETTAGATTGAALKPTAPSEAEIQAVLDPAAKQEVEKLRAAKPGPAFDSAYLEAQSKGHQQLLEIQEEYLKTGRNRETRAVAILTSGQIREHIALLKDLRDDRKDD